MSALRMSRRSCRPTTARLMARRTRLGPARHPVRTTTPRLQWVGRPSRPSRPKRTRACGRSRPAGHRAHRTPHAGAARCACERSGRRLRRGPARAVPEAVQSLRAQLLSRDRAEERRLRRADPRPRRHRVSKGDRRPPYGLGGAAPEAAGRAVGRAHSVRPRQPPGPVCPLRRPDRQCRVRDL